MDDDDDDDASVTDEVQQKLINPYHTGFPDCLHRDGRNATSNLLQQMVDHDHDGDTSVVKHSQQRNGIFHFCQL